VQQAAFSVAPFYSAQLLAAAVQNKIGRLKMRDLKMRDQNAGAENARPSSMESYLAIKCANGILMLCQPDISFAALSTVITNRTQHMFEYNV